MPITSICNKADGKGLFSQCFMLDQHWLGFRQDINDLPDDDLNAAVAVLTYVRPNRFAPATVEQRCDGGHARCWRCILGARDASQHLDAHFGVRTRQRP